MELVQAFEADELLGAGDDHDAALLVDVYEVLDASAVKHPRVHHRLLLQLVLRVDFVDDLKQDLLHH